MELNQVQRVRAGLRVVACGLACGLLVVGCSSDPVITSTDGATGTGSSTAGSGGTTGGGGTADPAGTVPDEEAAAANVTATSQATGPGAGESGLAAGEHVGYVKSSGLADVDGNQVQVVEFDLAELLTGPQADQAAVARGDSIDGDFYIVNDNPRTRQLPVADGAAVQVLLDGGTQLGDGEISEISADRLVTVTITETAGRAWVTTLVEVYTP